MAGNTAHLSGPDAIDVEVGITIRRLRKERGLSQTELGTALGITFQQIQKYERGTNRISASMMVKAPRALGVQPADLLLPKIDAAPLPPAALLQGYAAIKTSRHRGAVLTLVRAMRAVDGTDDEGE